MMLLFPIGRTLIDNKHFALIAHNNGVVCMDVCTHIRAPTLLCTDPPISDVVQADINFSNQNFITRYFGSKMCNLFKFT